MGAKKKSAARKTAANQTEGDSAYFLKLVLYVIAGMFWIKLSAPVAVFGLEIASMPLGLIVGLMFASHDHFQIDRKIEYAVLIIVTIISFFLPTGIVI